jgi:hypothetical protein
VAVRQSHRNCGQVISRHFIHATCCLSLIIFQLRLEPIRRSPAHFEHMGCGSANGIDDDDNPALESVRASHETACRIETK